MVRIGGQPWLQSEMLSQGKVKKEMAGWRDGSAIKSAALAGDQGLIPSAHKAAHNSL